MHRHGLLFTAAALLLFAPPAARAASNLTATVELEVEYGPSEALVTFDVTFKNTGDSFCAASIYWSDLWTVYPCQCDTNPAFCGTISASDKAWEFTDPDLLGPGTTWTAEPLTFPFPYSSLPYRYMLFVDSIFSCPESNEGDNLICGEFTVDPETTKPDLDIVDCTIGQDPDFPAGVLFSATVRNLGETAAAPPVDVDFFLTGSAGAQDPEMVWGTLGQDFAVVTTEIPPGGEVPVTSSLSQCGVPGAYFPIFTVNGFETIEEADTSNNWCIPEPPVWECKENVVAPDLLVPELGVDEELLELMQIIRLTGKVRNQGIVPVTAQESFKLCLYEDWPQKPGECEVPEHGVNGWIIAFENGIGPALEVEFSQVSDTAGSGLHSYWARVDCDCVNPEFGEILEADEKNNEAKLSDVLIPVDGPDLVVSEFQATMLPIAGQNVIRYTVEVTNIGTEPITADIDVDLFRNAPLEAAPTLEEVLAAIDAGEAWPDDAEFAPIPGGLPPAGGHAQAVFTDWAPSDAGTYTAWVVVDIVNTILEADEANNAAGPRTVEYQPVPPTQGPNLAVDTFSSEVLGNQVTYDILVRNAGDEVAEGPFRIDLFRDRDTAPNLFEWSDLSISVDQLDPGEEAPWSFTWENVADGRYQSYLLVDTDNVVAETEEGDNLMGFLEIDVGALACPEGEILRAGCLCDGEPRQTGWCCDGAWSAVPCAPELPEVAEEVSDAAEEEPKTVFGGRGDGCGCRLGRPAPAPAAGPILLLLAAALWIGIRRVRNP